MTLQYAVLSARSGRSYTGKLFTVAAPDTEVSGNTITVTERTNAKGMFRASIDRTTALPAGDYIFVLLQGTLGAAVGYLTFTGTDGETATETPATVELDPAIETAIGSAAADAATLVSRLTSGRAANLDNLDVAVSIIQSQITALNNLSAKANWFGSLLLEVPDSGTRAYVFELVVKDDEDKLVNLDASPTIALVNAAGTDRSSLITTAIANPSTGRYTLTITVGTGTVNESLKLTASGTVSAEARYAVIAPQVVDYDNATQVALLLTRIGTPSVSVSADIASVSTKLGTPAGASVSADIASIKTDTGTTIPGLFTTLTTKIRKFFQLSLRKDSAIATDNATELTELNASGGSGPGAYSNITEAQEAIRDRGDAAWTTGGGGGGGDSATLMLSTTIATVTSQTVLILTDGTGENDAYKDMLVIVTDQDTATQKSRAMVASYAGNTKTLTLSSACTFTVAVGDTVEIVAVSGRTTEFTGAALTKLNAVQAAVVMQTGATGYSVVRPGGKIVLKAGDDYADDIVTTITLPVTDGDEVVYDRLTDATTSTIKFAAGRNRQKDLIVGTVTKASVSKSAGVTYVPIQIARSQITSAKVFNDYRYDIQVTTSGGKITTPVGGELEVEFDNAE
jgi:co-chaperonin GroES (HSP10)